MPDPATTALATHRIWKHVATDSLYYVWPDLCRCSTNGPQEGELSVVYFSLTYQHLCHRKADEFFDGRFVPVAARERK